MLSWQNSSLDFGFSCFLQQFFALCRKIEHRWSFAVEEVSEVLERLLHRTHLLQLPFHVKRRIFWRQEQLLASALLWFELDGRSKVGFNAFTNPLRVLSEQFCTE